jgi:hypothetical protein
MAIDPNAMQQTISYPGGTVTGALGLLKYIFGDVVPVWTRGPQGGGRRPYGSRQRSNAAAGEPIKLRLITGEIYSVRVTGEHWRFIDQVIANSSGTISEVYSERGTIYGPQAPAFLA